MLRIYEMNDIHKAVSVILGLSTIECNQLLVNIAKGFYKATR